MNNYGNDGIGDVQAFFDMKSQTTGIENAIGITSPWITLTIWIVQVVGFIAIGIWMIRIAADILALATSGMGKVSEVASKIGTGKAESYDSTKTYVAQNGVEIVLVICLTVLMMTGLLFRILSLALGGIGTILNLVFGLNLDGLNSKADAAAYKEGLTTRRKGDLRNEYDTHLQGARGYLTQLYTLSKDGVDNNNPQFKKMKRKYTTEMYKSHLISTSPQLEGGAGADLKLGKDYFLQHQYDDSVCNASFFDDETQKIWAGAAGGSSSGGTISGGGSITCGKGVQSGVK